VSRKLFYPDSRPWTRWWWFNVELREEDIKGQLDWVKASGFGGVELAFIYPLSRQPQATSHKPGEPRPKRKHKLDGEAQTF